MALSKDVVVAFQVGDPDEVFGQDDEVVAEVLSYKEQEVASTQ